MPGSVHGAGHSAVPAGAGAARSQPLGACSLPLRSVYISERRAQLRPRRRRSPPPSVPLRPMRPGWGCTQNQRRRMTAPASRAEQVPDKYWMCLLLCAPSPLSVRLFQFPAFWITWGIGTCCTSVFSSEFRRCYNYWGLWWSDPRRNRLPCESRSWKKAERCRAPSARIERFESPFIPGSMQNSTVPPPPQKLKSSPYPVHNHPPALHWNTQHWHSSENRKHNLNGKYYYSYCTTAGSYSPSRRLSMYIYLRAVILSCTASMQTYSCTPTSPQQNHIF